MIWPGSALQVGVCWLLPLGWASQPSQPSRQAQRPCSRRDQATALTTLPCCINTRAHYTSTCQNHLYHLHDPRQVAAANSSMRPLGPWLQGTCTQPATAGRACHTQRIAGRAAYDPPTSAACPGPATTAALTTCSIKRSSLQTKAGQLCCSPAHPYTDMEHSTLMSLLAHADDWNHYTQLLSASIL